MAIQHSAITDPDIHEPKGVASASLGQVYTADGAGSGDWVIIDARGFIAFSNITVPLTITYPASYTKVNPVTTAGGFSREVTEATTSRLTYTGTATKPVEVEARLSLSQASGSTKDIRVAIYKNGSIVALSETPVSLVTAITSIVVLKTSLLITTNDYFEVYVRNDGGSGDLTLYSFNLSLSGLGVQ